MNVKSVITLLLSLLLTNYMFGQSDKYLKSKLKYCNVEIEQLEDQVVKYESLLGLQNKEVQGIKESIQRKEREIEVLKIENYELQQIAVNMINVALKLEKMGNTEGALEVYKVLIKSYPNSLEAAASRIRIEDYTHELKGYDK